ncbi:MAG: hypoxanthine phosphoribosyltransferase [Clostridiales bacterium]|nr:hypoxanthine phosphoribosyltransferase [Clostridiales bacterium]
MIPDTSKILITSDEIKDMVARVAGEINRDYGDRPVLVVPILTGAFIFAADLVRLLKMPVEIDFMQVASYQGTESTGNLKIRKDLSADVAGRDVLIVEDVIDTGRTLVLLRDMLTARGAASVKICTAFDKPSGRTTQIKPDYNGIVVPDEFIVGYGLDLDGRFRDFGDIRVVRDKKE